MGSSILIFGGHKKSRVSVLEKYISNLIGTNIKQEDFSNKADIKLVTTQEGKKSIGIQKAKEGAKFLIDKPYELAHKFLVFKDAEKLTTQAQNSLLKTLEEPPSYARIILLTKSQNSLLETIVSRCKKINALAPGNLKELAGEGSKKITLKKILAMEIGERLDWAAEHYKEEFEDIILVLENWILQEREMMIKAKNNDVAKVKANNIKKIMKIVEDLENTNVNTRLALENLVINLE